MDEFVLDAYANCLEADEIVTEVQVPVPTGASGSGYVAFKRTAAAFPTCSETLGSEPVEGSPEGRGAAAE